MREKEKSEFFFKKKKNLNEEREREREKTTFWKKKYIIYHLATTYSELVLIST